MVLKYRLEVNDMSDLLSLQDLNKDDIYNLFDLSQQLREELKKGKENLHLKRKTVITSFPSK